MLTHTDHAHCASKHSQICNGIFPPEGRGEDGPIQKVIQGWKLSSELGKHLNFDSSLCPETEPTSKPPQVGRFDRRPVGTRLSVFVKTACVCWMLWQNVEGESARVCVAVSSWHSSCSWDRAAVYLWDRGHGTLPGPASAPGWLQGGVWKPQTPQLRTTACWNTGTRHDTSSLMSFPTQFLCAVVENILLFSLPACPPELVVSSQKNKQFSVRFCKPSELRSLIICVCLCVTKRVSAWLSCFHI